MIQDALQLGGTVAVTIGFIELIRFLIGKFVPTDGRRQADTMETIADNHLNHIEEAIKEQTRCNNEWHEKQFQILCEINAGLKAII